MIRQDAFSTQSRIIFWDHVGDTLTVQPRLLLTLAGDNCLVSHCCDAPLPALQHCQCPVHAQLCPRYQAGDWMMAACIGGVRPAASGAGEPASLIYISWG